MSFEGYQIHGIFKHVNQIKISPFQAKLTRFNF